MECDGEGGDGFKKGIKSAVEVGREENLINQVGLETLPTPKTYASMTMTNSTTFRLRCTTACMSGCDGIFLEDSGI